MAATVAMQSRNDLRRAGLATLEPTGISQLKTREHPA